MEDTERTFYQQTIANLLQYNGQLISALVSRGQMIPPAFMSMPTSIPKLSPDEMNSFGIPISSDFIKDMMHAFLPKKDKDDELGK